MRTNGFSKKKKFNTPPLEFFLHQFFLNVRNSMKLKENMKFKKNKFLKFYFFQYLKNS